MDKYLFSDLKVIDIATVIAGPAAAMMLADFGANVIKVEQPGEGDMLRTISTLPTTPTAPSNYLWQMDGRNKRSISLDLKTDQGMDVLLRLIGECDVFITNQPYPVREALKLTFEDLEPLNPTMIYASLTAYGENGPERDRKGFDQLAYWARSGLMDLMRAPDTPPTQGLPGMGDHPTAVSIYAGIVTALLQRERTGKGGMVQTSLLANGLWSASCIAQGAMAGADMADYREVNLVSSSMMRSYLTSDGRWLQLNMIRTEELRDLLFTAMDALHLVADARFDTDNIFDNRELLGQELQKVIGLKTSDEWLELFEAMELPVNRVGLVEELVDDVQVLGNGMAIRPKAADIDVPLIVSHPVRITSVPQVEPTRAPELGEHSEEILRELGFSSSAIDAMKNGGVI